MDEENYPDGYDPNDYSDDHEYKSDDYDYDDESYRSEEKWW